MNGLPNPYQRVHQCYKPVLVPTEQTSFYINFDSPYPGVNSNLKLAIFKGNTNVADDIGTLQWQLVGYDYDTDPAVELYNIYCTFTCPEIEPGDYRLVIYDSAADRAVYVSNYVSIVYQSEAITRTVVAEYRNQSKIYNYYYEDLSFMNKIRIDLHQADYQPDIESKTYRPASTGKLRNIRTNADMVLTLETYKFDEGAHLAAIAMFIHDTIILNGYEYAVKEPYKRENNPFTNVSKGNVQLFDQAYSQINKK